LAVDSNSILQKLNQGTTFTHEKFLINQQFLTDYQPTTKNKSNLQELYLNPVSKTHQITPLYSTTEKTRSSAVAERPRDASCLSVVSFNIQRSFFITSYCGFRFTSA